MNVDSFRNLKSDLIVILLFYINFMFISKVIKEAYIINDFNYGYISLIYLCVSGIYILYKYALYRKLYKVLFIVAVTCTFAVIIVVKFNKIYAFLNTELSGISDLNYLILNSSETHFSQYRMFIIFIMPIVIILTLIFESKGFYNFVIFELLAVMITFWYTGFADAVKQNLFKYVFVTTVTFICNSCIKTTKDMIRNGVNIATKNTGVFVYSILFSLFIALIISVLPQTVPGKYSSTIKKKFEKKFSSNDPSKKGSGKTEYSISLSGYLDSDKELGGPVSINDNLVLRVKSDKPYYLKGVVKNYYDGFSWTKKNSKYIKKDKLDIPFNQGACTFTLLYSGKKKITVYPEDVKVSTIFVPEYVSDVDADQNVYYDKNCTFLVKGEIKNKYDVYYYPFYGSLGVISSSKDKSENMVIDNEYEYCFRENPDIMGKYLEYLQVPSNISKRTYDIVKEITRDCRTSSEKVQKIYRYLAENYRYSLEVSSVPEGQEFIDYFLFTERRGYCTYFATTATIFCRIAGIPARYVEGFNMTEKMDSKGLYMVTNKNAHAWTEVLIAPITNMWSIVDCVPDAEEQIIREENKKKISEEQDKFNVGISEKSKSRRKMEEKDEGGGSTQTQETFVWIKILLSVASSIMVCFIIYLCVLKLRKRKILKSPSIIPLYMFYLKKIRVLGTIKPVNLGDMEFALSIENHELKCRLIELTRCAYAEYYGEREISHVDKKEYYDFIQRYIKKEKSKSI